MTFIYSYLQKLKWRSIALQFLLIVIVFVGVSWYQQRNAVKGIAPEISATLLDASKVSLKQYRGKPVLLHFWATWCPICNIENSNINNLAKDYQVLSIAAWSGDAADVANYMAEKKLSMAVIVDDEGKWAALYGVKAVPNSFIIDANGVIQFVVSGYSTEMALRARLWWLEKQ